MNTEYETPVVDILYLSDNNVTDSDEHDNSYGDFDEWT